MNRKIFASVFVFLFFVGAITSFMFGTGYGIKLGTQKGYQTALNDVATLTDLDFSWNTNPDGTYTLQVYSKGTPVLAVNPRLDIYVEHMHDGMIVSYERHAGTLTNIGKDWIEGQISGTANTTVAKYISCSADTSAGMSAASLVLTNELATNGFTRATGTYASTGVGTWTVSKTFTSTGTQTVQLFGLSHDATSLNGNSLVAYDTSAAKNTVTDDTVAVTWSCSIA